MRIEIDGAERLAIEKSAAVDQVNRLADARLRQLVTPVSGQETVYAEKEAEARRYFAADPTPDHLLDFPWIETEMELTGKSAAEVAETFIDRARTSRNVRLTVDATRRALIAAIEGAKTLAAINEAIDAAGKDLIEPGH